MIIKRIINEFKKNRFHKGAYKRLIKTNKVFIKIPSLSFEIIYES